MQPTSGRVRSPNGPHPRWDRASPILRVHNRTCRGPVPTSCLPI